MKKVASTIVQYCSVRAVFRLFLLFVVGCLIMMGGMVPVGAVVAGISLVGIISNLCFLVVLDGKDKKED